MEKQTKKAKNNETQRASPSLRYKQKLTTYQTTQLQPFEQCIKKQATT